MEYIVGVDIGGTFTDCVAMDEQGAVTLGKALSTPDDFAVGAVDAVGDAARNLGLAGADLRNLVNEAALLAARREQNDVRQKDFFDALEKIVLGPERPLLLSHADRERILKEHSKGNAKPNIMRFKGLGEMNPDTLKATTLDPKKRISLRVTIPEDQALRLEDEFVACKWWGWVQFLAEMVRAYQIVGG